MSDQQVKFVVKLDVDGKEKVQQLGDGLEDLGRDAAGAGAAAATGARGVGQMGAAAQTAATKLDDAADSTKRLGGAAQTSESQFGATRRGLISISQQLDETRQHLAGLRDQLIAGFTFNQFVQAAAEMEQVQAGLLAVTGDSRLAGEQMDFVRRMASAAGVDVAAAGQAFLGLAAATKGTAVEGEPARQVFESVTLAMSKAGKSSAETQNALLALSQMASKGTVSMEELRGQLGEALPGALQAAANGLGIATQDLIKLVENGQLAAEDLFPALAKGLDDLYSGAPAAQTLSQEITNIKNAFVEMAANIGEEGGLDALKVGAEVAQTAITLLGDTLIQTGQYIGVMAAAITSLDFSGVSAAFEQIETDSRERLLKAAEHNEVLRNSLKFSSTDAIQAALAAKEHGQAAEQAGQQSAGAATGVAALGVAYAKVREEVATQIGLAEKEVEAVKARGLASVALANGLGDEQGKREAIAKAAADEAAAMDALAQKREAELGVLKAELGARQALTAQSGQASEQRKKEIAELEKLIAQKQIDVDKTRAQAAASQEKARANSAEVLATKAATDAAQALAITRKADAQVALQSLETQLRLAKQTEQLAVAMGDEEGARRARILQLEIEIKLVKARAAVAQAEAEGSIAVARAKLAEMAAANDNNVVKKAEIEASIKIAEAKLAEAKATGDSTELLERQLDALRNGTAATKEHTKSLRDNTDALQANAEASKGAGDVIDHEYASRMANKFAIDAETRALEAQAEQKRLGIDAEKYSVDAKGNRIVQEVNNRASVASKLGSMGLDEETAKRLAARVYDERGNFIGKGSGAYQDGDTLDALLLRLVSKAAGGFQVGGGSTTHNVNIRLGGRVTTINAASSDDATKLTGVLRELEVAARRS